MIISNCPVTQSDADVIKPYSRTHTGVDIAAETVYSASQGVVLYCGVAEDNFYTVTVSVLNSNCCFNYKHLSSCSVVSGENIEQGRVLGTAKKYVHVEFCNKAESSFALRVGKDTYYKQDPTDALSGTYVPDSNYVINLFQQYRLNQGNVVSFDLDEPNREAIAMMSDNGDGDE